MMFTPPVTTQFISNVERGVTPLPPVHIPTLTKALLVSDAELTGLMGKEYSLKLSDRLGVPEGSAPAQASPDVVPHIIVDPADHEFMRLLYDAIRKADPKTRDAFATVCESLLKLPKKKGTEPVSE